jgi:small subunit ribosomal protein S2
MNHRWLGGTLTNWQTVSQSISRLKSLDEKMTVGSEGLTKKERLGMEREQSKLQASLGGITQMGGVPDLLFVIDVKKEALAVAEANKLGIPVIAVVDTNCSPSGIDYLIPGNDDAARAIALYCDLIARSALDGMTEQMGAAGVDLGEMEDVPLETAVEAPVEEATTGEAPKEEATTNEVAAEEATTNEVAAEEAVVEKADTIAETEIAPKEKAKAKAKKEEVDNNETSSEEENGKVKEKVKASKAKTAKK